MALDDRWSARLILAMLSRGNIFWIELCRNRFLTSIDQAVPMHSGRKKGGIQTREGNSSEVFDSLFQSRLPSSSWMCTYPAQRRRSKRNLTLKEAVQ
jgi:hypothetical protein